MKAILVIFIVLGINWAINKERLFMTKHYYKKVLARENGVLQFSASIERLLEKAGANERIGYGRWCDWKVSHCIEFDACQERVEQCFRKAIGFYRFRCKNAFNFIYILEYPSRKFQEKCKENHPLAQKIITAFSMVVSATVGYFLNKILDIVVPSEWFSVIENLLK